MPRRHGKARADEIGCRSRPVSVDETVTGGKKSITRSKADSGPDDYFI
jgi:hypothetical protein